MNNSAAKVGEIFFCAGQAFNRLGELTMQLHQSEDSPSGSKWTDEEIEMLHSSINKFSDDLNKISTRIKNRTVTQIRQTLKKNAFEAAGIPVKQIPVQQIQIVQQPHQNNQQTTHQIIHQQLPQQSNQVIIKQPQVITSQQLIQSSSSPQIIQQHIIQKPQTQVIATTSSPSTSLHQQPVQVQHLQTVQVQQISNNTTTTTSAPSTVILSQSPQQSQSQTPSTSTNLPPQQSEVKMTTLSRLNNEMTLNRLNTAANDVDVEGLHTDVQMEFAGEEVAG